MSSFGIGSETDVHLVQVIGHELVRCTLSFHAFQSLASRLVVEQSQSKIVSVAAFSSYQEFLAQLYEFYSGCFKRDRLSTRSIPASSRDKLFNYEAIKIMKNRKFSVERGFAPAWDVNADQYEMEVPDEFGEEFRKTRNRASHVDHERLDDTEHPTLGEFYTKYHIIIMAMYHTGCEWWRPDKVEERDWRQIDSFRESILKIASEDA